MEKSVEKSQDQADIIKIINIYLHKFDTDYCKELAASMNDQASRQESMAVLNPSYPQEKNQMIRLQAKALSLLVEYVETLKEVDKISARVGHVEKQNNEISKLFL
jgi:hypothetical protein